MQPNDPDRDAQVGTQAHHGAQRYEWDHARSTREELEHAIRAACDLTEETEMIVFGSQAILGQYPDAPEELRQSAEADMAPKHAVDKVDLIDAVLGLDSDFHRTHGFYVHGVPIETAELPTGWENRAVELRNANTRENVGWCVEAHDLAASKLVPYRDKDLDFVRVLLAHTLVKPWKLRLRIGQLPEDLRDPERQKRLAQWLDRHAEGAWGRRERWLTGRCPAGTTSPTVLDSREVHCAARA